MPKLKDDAIKVRMTSDEAEKLRLLAEIRDVKMSEIARKALREYLLKHSAELESASSERVAEVVGQKTGATISRENQGSRNRRESVAHRPDASHPKKGR